jgi:hypothetical protein
VTTIKARPTVYKGIKMRSRLEAAFAQELDARDLEFGWKYEPECFADESGQYLPDFQYLDIYYEVKPPNADFAAALKRMHVIRSTWSRAPLFVVTRSGEREPFRRVAECTVAWPCDECRPPLLSELVERRWHEDFGPWGSGLVQALVCAGCGEHYVHTHLGEVHQRDNNGYKSGAVIEMSCETCSTVTTLSFQNHKGDGYVAITTSTRADDA